MRASSLSNRDVIQLVSQYFVPALLSRDDYGVARKSRAEDAEYRRIQTTAGRLGLSNGNVSIFILDPDGTPIATMPVTKALATDQLVAMLRKVIQDKNLKPRSAAAVRATRRPLGGPFAPQSQGGLMVHVWSRFLTNEVDKGVAEDWVELTPADWAALVPPEGTKVHTSWVAAGKLTDKLFPYCYPPMCEYFVGSSKIRTAKLTASLSAVSAGEMHVSLQGTLELDHSRDGTVQGRVNAQFIGLAVYDRTRKAVTSLRLVSEKAGYVFYWQNNPNGSKIAIGIESVLAADNSEDAKLKDR